MISRVRQLAPHVHLPLRHLALCLDCDECFKIGAEPCPACGSRTWVSLSRFMGQASSSRHPRRLDGSPSAAQRHDDHPAMVRQVIIVAGHRAHLYEHIKRAFAGNETVRVLLNRRIGERRVRSGPSTAERRQGDRRAPRTIDGLLRAMGLAVVPQAVPGTHRGSTR